MAKSKLKDRNGLKEVSWERFLRGPDSELLERLYIPALSSAVHYDRCCAYFSSTVLSTAAAGFGGFIEKLLDNDSKISKPAARLLVNEQLDRRDLEAMLATGDQSKLIKKLLAQFKTPKDALQRKRLEMLAWLVAEGWLEVRVGLMRNGGGLVHAKYGIVTDKSGDYVAFMGSGNETGEALLRNYEELEIRTSWQDSEFVNNYRERFEKLWADEDEYVATLPLPEAVKQKLIKFAPDEPPTAEPHGDKELSKTAMLWQFIAAAPYLPNGEYACDATAMVDLWPHQRRVVEDTAKAFPSGRLLCDEVGMGKTIEAIMVLRRLICGRGVKRALLLVPAGLLTQWQDELREKGGLLVPVWDDGYLRQPDGSKQSENAADAFTRDGLLLVSREWARLENNRNTVLTAPVWDLVLLDESHHARRKEPKEREFNSGNLLLQLMRELQLRKRARGILMLSATPMQTQPWEPWDLLSVLGIGGNWLVDFDDIRKYYNGVESLRRGKLDLATARFIGRQIATDTEFPDCPYGQIDTDAKAISNRLLMAIGEKGRTYADWLRRGAPLGRRMHRNTRDTLREYHRQGLSSYEPSNREIEDIVFDYKDPAERECYEAIERYINERYEQLEAEKSGKGFVMTIYRRRAASSPMALRRSLMRRLDVCQRVLRKEWASVWLTPEQEELDYRDLGDADVDERIDPAAPPTAAAAQNEKETISSLIENLNALGRTDSKLDEFWKVLRRLTSDGRSVLVFTEYTDTMEYLRDQLHPNYGETLGCYSGSGGQIWNSETWEKVSKAEITKKLEQGKLNVLICTDAASEGLNLQSASALVNYDLPWNPSKVEQRIGRIDRIGQEQQILPIANMFLEDSVDLKVYGALRTRCGLFEHFVGPMQPVLSMARDLLKKPPSPDDIDSVVQGLQQQADRLRGDAAVSGAFVYPAVTPFQNVHAPISLQNIEEALSIIEGSSGSLTAKPVKGERRWRLSGVGRRTIEVTTDRECLERYPHVLPITPGSQIMRIVSAKLSCHAGQNPLVLATSEDGPFCCAEARWVGSDKTEKVSSCARLLQLVEAWDSRPPSSEAIVRAQMEARKAARKRVARMKTETRKREEEGLHQQKRAAEIRLRRELARTLRCLGTADLNTLLQRQVQLERRQDGRYRRALKLLSGFPSWAPEDVEDADAFVQKLTLNDRQARINLASELEAALNDPRWLAGVK